MATLYFLSKFGFGSTPRAHRYLPYWSNNTRQIWTVASFFLVKVYVKAHLKTRKHKSLNILFKIFILDTAISSKVHIFCCFFSPFIYTWLEWPIMELLLYIFVNHSKLTDIHTNNGYMCYLSHQFYQCAVVIPWCRSAPGRGRFDWWQSSFWNVSSNNFRPIWLLHWQPASRNFVQCESDNFNARHQGARQRVS